MYSITIDAETADELRHKLINLTSIMAGGGDPVSEATTPPVPANSETETYGIEGSPPKSAKPEEAPEPKKAANGSGAPPVAETQPVEPPAPEPEPTEVEPEPEVEQPDAIANEKVKNEVIRSLEAIHRAGRVDVIRSALYKYGNGAKSFLEIDAAVFPDIKEALARGEIA